MTVLQACASAAMRLVSQRPSTIFYSTDTFEMELQDLVNEVAADIAKSADWQALIRIATLTGDGVTTAFDLPSDYARMLIKSDFIDSNNFAWGYSRIHDINEFLALQSAALPGNWILYGNQLHFTPVPASGSSTQFPYIDENYATDTNGTPKAAFTVDNDIFRLNERLLTLGLVWRWRQNKKLSYGEDEAAFSKAFAELSGRDRGSRIFATGPSRFPGNVSMAYPWQLGP